MKNSVNVKISSSISLSLSHFFLHSKFRPIWNTVCLNRYISNLIKKYKSIENVQEFGSDINTHIDNRKIDLNVSLNVMVQSTKKFR